MQPNNLISPEGNEFVQFLKNVKYASSGKGPETVFAHTLTEGMMESAFP